MAECKLANYVRTTIATATVAVDATTFDATDGTVFPALGAGDYFYLVLVRASDNAKEIVKVTDVTTDTLTVVRAQESTTALALTAGDRCEVWLTAAALEDRFDLKVPIAAIVNDLTTGGTAVPLSAEQGKTLKTAVDAKVATAAIVDNVTSTDTNKPLSANQGKVLKTAVDLKVATADVQNVLTSTETTKPLSAAQGKVLADRMEFQAKRQTVLSGETNSSGRADFLTYTGKTVTLDTTAADLVLSAAAGYDARGPVDIVGVIDADLTWTDPDLTDNTTNYLYLDYDATNGWTVGATVLEPEYATDEPVTPSTGQHWFDLTTFKMMVYDGADWDEEARVMVGEAVTDASGNVTSTVCYALRGYYDSGENSSNLANTSTILTNSLGYRWQHVGFRAYARQKAGKTWVPFHVVGLSAGAVYGSSIAQITLNTCRIRTEDYTTQAAEHGVSQGGYDTNFQVVQDIRVIAQRIW